MGRMGPVNRMKYCKNKGLRRESVQSWFTAKRFSLCRWFLLLSHLSFYFYCWCWSFSFCYVIPRRRLGSCWLLTLSVNDDEMTTTQLFIIEFLLLPRARLIQVGKELEKSPSSRVCYFFPPAMERKIDTRRLITNQPLELNH